jgi:hypothetical protein
MAFFAKYLVTATGKLYTVDSDSATYDTSSFTILGDTLTLLNSNAGHDTVYLTGNFADYVQTVNATTGLYTFTRGTEVINISASTTASRADIIYFNDGHLALRTDVSYGTGGNLLQAGVYREITATDIAYTTGTKDIPSASAALLGASTTANTANATTIIVNDAAGTDLAPTLPGQKIVVKGGVGVDRVVVTENTGVDFRQSSSGNDVAYLSGNFADYDQTISGATYTFTHKDNPNEYLIVAGTTNNNNSDYIYFADGNLKMDTDLMQGSGTALLTGGVYRNVVFADLNPAFVSPPPTPPAPADHMYITNLASSEVAENAVYTSTTPLLAGTPVGAVNYTLSGDDADKFTVNPLTGVVTMIARNYEAPADTGGNNIYNYTLTATDSGGNSDTQDVAVTVTDVKEITITRIGNSSVVENTAYTSDIPTVIGNPVGALTYTLSGDDAGLFTVNSSTGVVSMVARDFEAPADTGVNNVYDYTLTATDTGGNSDTQDVAVTVTDMVIEQIYLGTWAGLNLNLIHGVTTADGKVYYYLDLSGDGTSGGWDYANHDQLDALFNAENSGADTVDTQAGGAVKGVDDARTVNIGGYTLVLPTATELQALAFDPLPNPPVGWADVGYWASTQNGWNNHYGVTLASGTLSTANDAAAGAVTLQVLASPSTFTITSLGNSNVNESAAYTSATPVLTGAPVGAVTYTLAGADAGLFTVNSSTGVVSMIARNFEAAADDGANNVYNYTLIATDSGGKTATQNVAVTVDDVIEVSAIAITGLGNSSVNENATYTSATPALSGTPIGAVTYSLSGADASLFTVDAASGVVSMTARNFETPTDTGANNVYDYTLTATDADGNSDIQAVAVTVNDLLDQTMIITALGNSSVMERSAYTSATPVVIGNPVGALTYTLSGNDAGLFTVDATTGVVSMVARDYEIPVDTGTNNVYDYTLIATDTGGNSDTQAVAVTVTDMVNEPLYLGTVAGVNLNLIYGVTTADGKVYYYLDQSGDGTNAGNDWRTHEVLDNLFNGGADTVDTQAGGAVKGVDDARTVIVGGYTLVLPTQVELLALYNDPLANPPADWATSVYWSASQTALGAHSVTALTSGENGNYLDVSPFYVALQVL